MKLVIQNKKKFLTLVGSLTIVVFLIFSIVFFILNKKEVCIKRESYSICFPEQYAITGEGNPFLENMFFSEKEEINVQLYEEHAEETILIRELFKSDIGQQAQFDDENKWRVISSFVVPQAYIYNSTKSVTIADNEFYVVRYQRCTLPECEPIDRFNSVYIAELSDRYVLFFINEISVEPEYFETNILSTFK